MKHSENVALCNDALQIKSFGVSYYWTLYGETAVLRTYKHYMEQ